jgi:hypothetical protein
MVNGLVPRLDDLAARSCQVATLEAEAFRKRSQNGLGVPYPGQDGRGLTRGRL